MLRDKNKPGKCLATWRREKGVSVGVHHDGLAIGAGKFSQRKVEWSWSGQMGKTTWVWRESPIACRESTGPASADQKREKTKTEEQQSHWGLKCMNSCLESKKNEESKNPRFLVSHSTSGLPKLANMYWTPTNVSALGVFARFYWLQTCDPLK